MSRGKIKLETCEDSEILSTFAPIDLMRTALRNIATYSTNASIRVKRRLHTPYEVDEFSRLCSDAPPEAFETNIYCL
jgi:hypothetical protein